MANSLKLVKLKVCATVDLVMQVLSWRVVKKIRINKTAV